MPSFQYLCKQVSRWVQPFWVVLLCLKLSASTFFSFSSSVIYFTVHKFIDRNFLSLALTTFFFVWYHSSSLSKYSCPSYCTGNLITLGLFQEEWRPCYFIYSFTVHSFSQHLMSTCRCQILGCRGESLLCRHSQDLEGGGSGNSSYLVS